MKMSGIAHSVKQDQTSTLGFVDGPSAGELGVLWRVGPTRGALRFCAIVGSAQADTQFWQMFACVYVGKAVDSTSGNHTKLL